LQKSYKNINKLLKMVPVAKPDYETINTVTKPYMSNKCPFSTSLIKNSCNS
jgi:hypothetical protein